MKKLLLTALFIFITTLAHCYPLTITDDAGNKVTFKNEPDRIVSLIPEYTDLINALGDGEKLVGITYHDRFCTIDKTVVGGFFNPNKEAITALKPDLVILSPNQSSKLQLEGIKTLVFKPGDNLDNATSKQIILSRILNKENKYNEILDDNLFTINLLNQKTALLPKGTQKRVIRVMGQPTASTISVPGDNSFQNQAISMAGGIPPVFGKNGDIINITEKQWRAFNPQVIYSCAPLSDFKGGMSKVDAVKNKEIYYFPCELTCRSGIYIPYFAAWLASSIYVDEFFKPDNTVYPDEIIKRTPVKVELDYVKKAELVESRISDFINRTFVLELKTPMNTLATSDGLMNSTVTVANHYSPPTTWGYTHKNGFPEFKSATYKVLGLDTANSQMLFTGADMLNLSVVKKSKDGMEVVVIATAGVSGNALRAGKDTGAYREPGTINIIVLTNRKLSKGAMASAMINVTEAKTTALWDLDIRSSQTPLINPASGTGTDSIIVVEGTGAAADFVLGHTVLGQIMAEAAYQAVTEAIYKQNGIAPKRHVFFRLNERNINLYNIIYTLSKDKLKMAELETELMNQIEFLEAALSLSDAYIMGHMHSYSDFEKYALIKASDISGEKIVKIENFITDENIPPVIKKALNAIITGVNNKKR